MNKFLIKHRFGIMYMMSVLVQMILIVLILLVLNVIVCFENINTVWIGGGVGLVVYIPFMFVNNYIFNNYYYDEYLTLMTTSFFVSKDFGKRIQIIEKE